MATRQVEERSKQQPLQLGQELREQPLTLPTQTIALPPPHEETISWHSYKQKLSQPRATILSTRTEKEGLSYSRRMLQISTDWCFPLYRDWWH